MTLFKKNKKNFNLSILLYDEYKRAREDNKSYFYHALFDNEKDFAEQFCRKNHLRMTLDHKTDGNLIYKFIIEV